MRNSIFDSLFLTVALCIPAKDKSKELCNLHFLSISPINCNFKMRRAKNQREKMKIICPETWLVIKCFLPFSSCYSHQMLVVLKVIVPKSQMPRKRQGKIIHDLCLPKRKNVELKAAALFSAPHRTLDLHQLQSGSVGFGSGLKVKKVYRQNHPLFTYIYSRA